MNALFEIIYDDYIQTRLASHLSLYLEYLTLLGLTAV